MECRFVVGSGASSSQPKGEQSNSFRNSGSSRLTNGDTGWTRMSWLPALASSGCTSSIGSGTSIVGVVVEQHPHSEQHPREVLKATKVTVEMGEKCYYQRPPGDFIVLPPQSWFHSEASYWSTVLHELIHRCEWILGYVGSEAAGELRAEVGVALLESILGHPHCPDQTNYRLWRPAWLKEWEDDPESMVRAVTGGVEAAEFLLSYLNHEDSPNDPQVESEMNALVERILGKSSLQSSTPSVVASHKPEGKHEQENESSSGNHRPDCPGP
jgi:hypothetical protein